MTINLVNNAFTCFLITITALVVFALIIKRKREDKEALSFAIFCLLAAILWFSIALRIVALWLDSPVFVDIIFYFSECMIALHMIPLGYHILYKLTKNERWAWGFAGLYTLFSLAYLYTLFTQGGATKIVTAYGLDYGLEGWPQIIFNVQYFLGIPLVVFDFMRRLGQWVKTKKLTQRASFLTSSAILLYGFAGYLDVIGYQLIWWVFFYRIISLTSFMVAYFAYPWKSADRENEEKYLTKNKS